MNYIRMWVCRDEIEPNNDRLFISQLEPEYFMGKWQHSKNQIIFTIGLIDTDIYCDKGQKKEVKLLLQDM